MYPLRTNSQANLQFGVDRSWLPVWSTTPLPFTASQTARPSSTELARGFSQ